MMTAMAPNFQLEGSVNQVRRILIPVEFSDNTERSFQQALDIAKRYFGATITLLHVNEPILSPEVPVGPIVDTPADTCSYFTERLRALANTQGTMSGPPMECRCITGTPSRCILDAAEQGSFDFIIMSTHGYTGIKHWLLGSVTEKVVREAVCPVITFRPVVTEKEKVESPVLTSWETSGLIV